MSVGGKGAQIEVVDYRMSLHYAFCYGPVDAVHEIIIGDKPVFNPPDAVGDPWVKIESGFEDVDIDGFHGGDKKGGGILGRIHFLLGAVDQLMPEYLATKFELTPTTMPGYRRIYSVFFSAIDSLDGFTWGTNNPNVPAASSRVTRAPKPLQVLTEDEPLIDDLDANPSHIIYECLVDPMWGLGAPPADIDVDSFLVAAQTLRDEEFGLSFLWADTSSIEEFINDVCSHIDAVCKPHPTTGLWRLKLTRDDYSTVSLPTISPSNAKLVRFQRRGWGETVNEVVVSWTNPTTEEAETVVEHDNANITIQGGVVSSPRNYHGVRNPTLARRLCLRDLRQLAAPLATADLIVDRSLWALAPGDVARFQWPALGVDLIVRVGTRDPGNVGDPGIKLNVLEDIFSFPGSIFDDPDYNWVSPSQTPTALDNLFLGTIPYYLLAQVLGDTAAQALDFPDTHSLLVASTAQSDVRDVDVLISSVDSLGNTLYVDAGTVDRQGVGELTAGIGRETQSVTAFSNFTGPSYRTGFFVIIGDGDDDSTPHEIAVVVSVAGANVTLRRGVLDTYPQAWDAGTKIRTVDPRTRLHDTQIRTAAAELEYKFLPITSLGRLAEDDAPVETLTPTERHYRPLRPANIEVDGELHESTLTIGSLGANIVVDWSRRNRLTETSQILSWAGGDVTPEAGQTTTIEVLAGDGTTVLATYSGLTGTTHNIPVDVFEGPELVVDGGFDNAGDWDSVGANWAIAGSVATKTASAGAQDVRQSETPVVGAVYKTSFEVVSRTAGGANIVFVGGTLTLGSSRTSVGVFTEDLTAQTGNTSIGIRGNAAFAGSVDNLSIKRRTAPGNYFVDIWSVRDGYDSFVKVRHPLTLQD